MTTLRFIRLFPVLILTSVFTTACGSGSSAPRQVPVGPTEPSGQSGGSGTVTLTAPTVVSPTNGEQLGTLRPTLVVQNGTTSNQSGTRTYQFQVSDRADFSLGASLAASFLVAVDQTGVPEGDGRTQFTVPSELQPTTRMYWRARMVQGTTTTDWTPVAMFKTKLVGYNRPGELYDPLVHGETIGLVIGAVSFINGKGAQLNDQRAYIRYQLPTTLTSGEFSVLVENLAPGAAGSKFKIFSMQSGTGNLIDNVYMSNVQYRGGINGNPDNSISFKALYGSMADNRKFEPSQGNREVRHLDPGRAYFWKWTWGSEVRLLVQDGIGGPTIYNYGQPTAGSYAPSPHYAYLGANTQGSVEEGSRPGAIIRQVWISNKPRPDTLGNALD
jgi:hypothetical protein